MARGEKSAYSSKQKRQAEHIEEGYEQRGVPEKTAAGRAWATVNKIYGGGLKGGSGHAEPNKEPSRKGGRKGGASAARRPPAARAASGKLAAAKKTSAKRSAAARKGAVTRKRRASAKAP
jgi:plasmid stabilization system protein ParE